MNKILPLILIILLAACSSEEQVKAETKTATPAASHQEEQQPHPPFQSISPTQAMQLIGSKANLAILDVRSTKEILRYGAVPKSVQTDIRAIASNGIANPKDQPILLVCAVGGRSYAVGKFLVNRGHTEIYNLSGGLSRWSQEGLPVVYPKQ